MANATANFAGKITTIERHILEEQQFHPEATGALTKAGLASRTNTLFSIPLLFFMASSVHLAQIAGPVTGASALSLIVVFGIIALLEMNAVLGKTGPLTSVKGVIHMGVLLTLVLYLGIDLL